MLPKKSCIRVEDSQCKAPTSGEQGAAPDRLQLRSFLSSLPAAGELVVSPLARYAVVCDSENMKNIAKAAALSILGLTAYHAYGAAVLFYVLATGRTTEWQLFGVVDCCDIPLTIVQSSTAFTAVSLAVVAYAGRWLVPGLWHFKLRSWWGSLALCSFIMLVHWMMTSGKVEFVKTIHWQFIGYCLVPVVLLIVSAPLYFKQSGDETA